MQRQHPADALAGNLAGALPLLAVPGVGGPGIMAGLRGGVIAGGLQGAAGSSLERMTGPGALGVFQAA
jgi:hypothetical protein